MAGSARRIYDFCNRQPNRCVCLGTCPPTPSPKKINVNDINNLNNILLYYGIDIVNDKNNYTISNSVTQDQFYKPYCEIIYPDEVNQINHVYVSQTNDITTIVLSDLQIDTPSAIINEKRFWMANMTVILNETFADNQTFPDYKYFNFLNPNYDSLDPNSQQTLNITTAFKKKTTSAMNENSGFYSETQVNRTSSFIYYPLKNIYALINASDPANVRIYIMQSQTNMVNDTINTTNLVYLKSSLELPDGWMFTIVLLDSETSIILTGNSTTPAYVLQDDFNNSYQYVPREQASFLYTQFTV